MDDPAKTHPVHGAVEQLLSLADSTQLSDLNEEIDEARRRYLDRIFYVVGEARKILKKISGIRANLNVFSNLQNSSEQIRQELNNYIANKNLGHIDNAIAQLDQGFSLYLSQLPQRSGPEESETVLESFRRSSRSAIGELKANEGILKKQIAELHQQIANQQALLDEARLANEQVKTDIALALQNHETSAESLKAQIEQDFDHLRQHQESQLTTAREGVLRTSEYLTSKIEEKRQEAASIVQAVGDILTTGTYKDTAEKESRLANRFRLITIGLFSVGILIVVSNFVLHVVMTVAGREFAETPWLIVSRFATAIAVALPALYTARESARHRTNADRARQRELELTTLGPFIELLPADKKAEIRDRLTDRYFGGEVESHQIASPVDTDSLAKMLEALAKLKSGTAG